jgi:hypothetical protein
LVAYVAYVARCKRGIFAASPASMSSVVLSGPVAAPRASRQTEIHSFSTGQPNCNVSDEALAASLTMKPAVDPAVCFCKKTLPSDSSSNQVRMPPLLVWAAADLVVRATAGRPCRNQTSPMCA